jgi:hypothetical protein
VTERDSVEVRGQKISVGERRMCGGGRQGENDKGR